MAKRQSVNFPGFSHQNPIPNASRIGNVMMTSVISGVDPGTRNLPPELSKQVTNLFTHVRTAIQQAGGTPDDIIKMTFWMKDPTTGRAALNDEWLKMFPDAASGRLVTRWRSARRATRLSPANSSPSSASGPTMIPDAQGYQLSGATEEAATRYDQAVRAFNLVHGDAVGQFDGVRQLAPDSKAPGPPPLRFWTAT